MKHGGQGATVGAGRGSGGSGGNGRVTICYGDSMNYERGHDHERRTDDVSAVAWAPVCRADGDVMAIQSKAAANGKARLFECIGERTVYV